MKRLKIDTKSVTVAIDGRYTYGHLRAERGVHRLVRISPYDSQKRRHTTFALVEVLPEVEDDTEVGEIPEDELRIETLDALKPALIKAVEGTEFLYLLMPVRVT